MKDNLLTVQMLLVMKIGTMISRMDVRRRVPMRRKLIPLMQSQTRRRMAQALNTHRNYLHATAWKTNDG